MSLALKLAGKQAAWCVLELRFDSKETERWTPAAVCVEMRAMLNIKDA
jgi:hypothetical protein